MSIKTYVPLVGRNHHEYWLNRHSASFVPTDRQHTLMDTYIAAKAAGHYYTSDVLLFTIQHLNIPDDVSSVGKNKVEGGDVGMDIYYARDAVDCVAARMSQAEAHNQLKATVGMSLGSLSIGRKRTNLCTITEIAGNLITFTAKRGSYTVQVTANAEQIIYAANDAFKKGWRKSVLV